MIDLIAYLSIMAVCPEPTFINKSEEKWEKADYVIYHKNIDFCKTKFKGSPCVAKFIKLGPRRYHIMCGKKRGQRPDFIKDRD